MNKTALALIIILAISSLMIVESAFAQSITKPSVPEFTLKIVARPFDVPPVTTINPYTGQTIITHGGYHAENKSIDVIIKNQPSVSYYQIQFKGHYETNWRYYSTLINLTPTQLTWYIQPSSSEFKVISVPINNEEAQVSSINNFPDDGQLDFQVRALIGQPSVERVGQSGEMVFFYGETSDWSNTQTITIPSNTGSISTTPNPTMPYIPIIPPTINSNGSTQITIQLSFTNLLLLVGVVLVVVLVAAIWVLLSVRHRKTTNLGKK